MAMRQATASLFRRVRPTWRTAANASTVRTNALPIPLSRKIETSFLHCPEAYSWGTYTSDPRLWFLISGPVAIILGINTDPVLAKDISNGSRPEIETDGAGSFGLTKVEDGSVVSNVHTSKWRIFTDKARESFLKGNLDEAEKFFLSAIQEAKEGFGERDGHVASSYNNLAELYRVKKEFDKAEPLYLEAINILEESFGPEDVRVGAALHNLGQFYLVQRKLEEARINYERALKINGHVLGYGHPDYAETMYHLGTVLYLQGKENDAEAFIQDSIRILEEGGQGESFVCLKRIRYLSQIYLKSNRFDEAEILQRKILHTMELSKGWNSMETATAAEGLALTLQSSGNLKEAQELLQRCLEARKNLLPDNHIQIAANMLHIGRVAMLSSSKLQKTDFSTAMHELEKAKGHLYNSARIARQALDKLVKQRGNLKKGSASGESRKERRVALMILMQSLNALGLLEMTKQKQWKSPDRDHFAEAERPLRECISSYKEVEAMKLIPDGPELKAEYLACLKQLSSLISAKGSEQITIQELKAEIDCLEREIYSSGKHRK